MKATTNHALSEALAEANTRATPSFLLAQASTSPDLERTRLANSVQALCDWAEGLELPCVAFLGPFNAGKSTLVNLLLGQSAAAISNMPTTAAITIYRHISARPATWPVAAAHGLKPGAQVRSLNPNDVTASGDLHALRELTTYADDGSNSKHEVVAVFLDAPILKFLSLIDVPGLGTYKDQAVKAIETDGNKQARKLSDERRLQELAIREADGYVLTSNMQTCVFRDGATAELISLLVECGTSYPGTVPHSNWLLVGTNADPTQRDTADDAVMQSTTARGIADLVGSLQNSHQAKIDVPSLCRRLVFSYVIEETQRAHKVKEFFNVLRSVQPDADPNTLYAKAEQQTDASLRNIERVTGIRDRFLNDLGPAVIAGADAQRDQRIIERCILSSGYHSDRAEEIMKLREATAIWRYFDETREPREQGWQALLNAFRNDCDAEQARAVERFSGAYDILANKDVIYEILKEEFGDNQKACKEQAGSVITRLIESRLKDAIDSSVEAIVSRNRKRLEDFDNVYLKGKTEHNGRQFAKRDAAISLASPIISASGIFKDVLLAAAGTTTLLTAAGNVFAATAFKFVLGTGVAVLSGVGLGGVATAVLAAIPVWGWIAMGVAAIWTVVIKFWAWRKNTAESIEKLMRNSKNDVMNSVIQNLTKHFSEFSDGGLEVLNDTKNQIDQKIDSFESAASAAVPIETLDECANYLRAESATLKRLATSIREQLDGVSHG